MNDKMQHLIAGLIISLVVGYLYVPHIGWIYGTLLGFMASIVAGIGKEMWDSCGHGVSDVDDFLATAQGGAIGALLALFLW